MNRKTWVPLLGVLLLWFGSNGTPQSSTTLRPPAQTYIHNFNGQTYAVAPDAPAWNLGATYSIEFWIMLDRDAVDSQFMRVFQKEGAYGLSFEPGTHRLSYGGATTTVALAPGEWNHVAVVSDNLRVTLYLNGQPQGRATAAAPPPVSSRPLVLAGQAYGDGARQLCCGFPGSLRQFRIWSRALAEAEVPSVATRLLSGNEAGLVAGWPIDEGQGNTLRDVSPNRRALNLEGYSPRTPDWSPWWMRTVVVDSSPYFQVQRLTVPPPTIESPALTIPIDFDSNGTLDLVTCQAYKPTVVPCAAFRNLGNGDFRDVTRQVLGPQPPAFETARDFAVADFNGDGRDDVFIANTGECFPFCGYSGGYSALLTQTTDGRLVDETAGAGLPRERIFTHNVTAADVDGDGDVDLFLANVITGDIAPPQLYLNDGQGRFTLADPSRLTALLNAGGLNNFGVARFVDANRDGSPDLVLAGGQGVRDLLLLNDGQGNFRLAPDNSLPPRYGGGTWGTVSFGVVDFDGDGWQDLVNTVNYRGDREGAVQILLNNRDGTFRDATGLIVQPAWPHGNATDLAWVKIAYPADLNGDGLLDILVENGPGLPPRFLLNTGPAGGGRLVEISEMLPASRLAAATSLAVADFNGDGSKDIVAWAGEVLETWTAIRPFAPPPGLIPPVPAGPFFQRGGVLNSASFGATTLAPGLIVTIFGRNLGPGELAVASPRAGAYPTELAGSRVLFNDVAAPVIYASSGQISTVVPFNVVPGTQATVIVEYQGIRSPPVSIFVERSAPGMFTSDSSGAGAAAVLNVDPVTGGVTLNSPQNPAQRGGVIVAYITGAGRTDPPSPDGAVATGAGGLALSVAAGLEFWAVDDAYSTDSPSCASSQWCQPVEVLYAGPAPGLIAGVAQVNLRLPNTTRASGTHQLGVSIGGVWSQHNVTISVR